MNDIQIKTGQFNGKTWKTIGRILIYEIIQTVIITECVNGGKDTLAWFPLEFKYSIRFQVNISINQS